MEALDDVQTIQENATKVLKNSLTNKNIHPRFQNSLGTFIFTKLAHYWSG